VNVGRIGDRRQKTEDRRRKACHSVFWVLSSVILAILPACGGPPVDSDERAMQTLEADRARKNRLFATASDSPVPANRRGDFLPLSYFGADPSYRVPAVLEPSSGLPDIIMPTSTGQQRSMRRVGTLRFSLKGQSLSLGAFVESDAPNLDRLFVPFTDLTSGTETYPAGRYLDLERTPTGIYVIDFNRAYQPYCYYNSTYDCPYPPPGNRLPMPIHAGERLHLAAAR
jgi:uncharacterized protein